MPERLARPDTLTLGAAAALLAASLACGLIAPPLFWLLLIAAVLAGVVFLAFCFPTGFTVAWLLVAGMSLEMTASDLLGGDAYQSVIAIVKGIEIGLGLLCMVRFGPSLDPLCPAWAFLAMTATGLMHGLYPGMAATDSLRSMIGSVAPFAFCFAQVPRSWSEAVIRAAKWCPLMAVGAGLPLAGWRSWR